MASLLFAAAFGACGSEGSPSGQDAAPGTLVCESDAECDDEAPYCDPFAGCVECLLTTQCDEGERCTDRRCVTPTACTSSDDCEGDDEVCDTVQGECVGCVSDADCGDQAVCLERQCEAKTPCINSRDCEDGSVCDRDAGYCVECVADGDCSDQTTCVENRCVDRCASDNDCIEAGLLCNHEVGHCVECVEHIDCPDVYHCNSGRCVVDICDAGVETCSDATTTERCNSEGSELTIDDCPFRTSCTEVAERAVCSPWVCTPGSTQCTGDAATIDVCNADGQGFTLADCAAMGAVCENDECAGVVCDAGARFCLGRTSMRCSDSGASYTLAESCSETQYCEETSGQCADQVCSPGSKSCDGTLTTACNTDGSQIEVGQDCADDGELCFEGECMPRLCEGTRYCKDGDVYNCENDGTTDSLYDTCDASEYCDDSSANVVCRVQACVPDSMGCADNSIGVCNAEGSAYIPETPCDTDESCVGGACLLIICDPGAYLCDDSDVFVCSSDGTTTSFRETCDGNQFCEEGRGCRRDVCDPGTPVCDGSLVSSCKSDGSGPEPDGSDCGPDKTCDGGICTDVICVADQDYCEDDYMYFCNSLGTGHDGYGVCADDRYCDDSTGELDCPLDICAADEPACDGETLATCNPYGGAYVEQTTDCSSTGQVCDMTACVDAAEDTVGSTDTSNSANDQGAASRFYMHTDRTLTEIEAYASVSESTDFDWFVYEGTTSSGTYNKIFDSTNASSGTATFHSSGPIEVSLQKGLYYIVGVRVAGSAEFFHTPTNARATVSFGQWIWGVTMDLGTSPLPATWSGGASSTQYYQHLTTEAP